MSYIELFEKWQNRKFYFEKQISASNYSPVFEVAAKQIEELLQDLKEMESKKWFVFESEIKQARTDNNFYCGEMQNTNLGRCKEQCLQCYKQQEKQEYKPLSATCPTYNSEECDCGKYCEDF